MKKGITLVEIIIVMVCIAVLTILVPRVWKITPRHSPAVNRLERPLKQFAVSQSGFSGSFFLASGSISGSKEYYFYYKTKKGDKFRPASVSLRETSIVEDGQNKIIFVTEPLEKDDVLGIEDKIDQGEFGYYNDNIKEFEFHIPPGSILENYDPNFSSSKQ